MGLNFLCIEFFDCFCNTIKNIASWLLDSSENIKNIADVIALIIGGVCVIKGLNYLKILKEKKVSTTFGFWSHLLVDLVQLEKRLKEEPGIINNLYSHEAKVNWSTNGVIAQEYQIKEFKIISESTLKKIKSVPDQLPAYKGWVEDYLFIIEFLDDIIYYDIENPMCKFKFKIPGTKVENRNEYAETVCLVIKRLIDGIKNEQKKAENSLYGK